MRTRTERRLHAGFSRMPGARKPFKRAIELHGQIIDKLAKLHGALPIDRQIAMDAVPQYVSRGHGGRHRVMQRIVGSHQFQDRSKYSPRDVKNKPMLKSKPRGYDLAGLVSYAAAIKARPIPSAA